MITKSQQRAQVGGEIGKNGEEYKGGQFIATTEKPKTQPRQRGMGKVEVAPYTYETAPDGMRSIYRKVSEISKWKVWQTELEFSATPQQLAYAGLTEEIAEGLIEKWNNGERWF